MEPRLRIRMRHSGRAERRREVEARGFFIIEGKLVPVNVEV